MEIPELRYFNTSKNEKGERREKRSG